MKINAKGSVTFSVRSNDKDLHAFFEELPDGTGSDIIRALIRDGLAYQKLLDEGKFNPSHLQMLCTLRRMNLDGVLTTYFDAVISEPVKKVSKKAPKKDKSDTPSTQQNETTEQKKTGNDSVGKSNDGTNDETDDLMGNATYV